MKLSTTFHSNKNKPHIPGSSTILVGAAFLMLVALSSCNTTRGFGRDVQKVGGKIENAAERAVR